MEVYPNPFTSFLTIDGTEVVSVEIRDLTGKLLHKTEEKKIDTSEFDAGIYLLILKNVEEQTVRSDQN